MTSHASRRSEAEASLSVRPLHEEDGDWVRELLLSVWDTVELVSRGRVQRVDRLPGFLAVRDGRRVGLVTYHIDRGTGDCEMVSLNSLEPGRGVGRSLVDRTVALAREKCCARVWLVTYNDNFEALRFFQRLGFRLSALHRGAVDEARRLRPAIPLVGATGIRLRDELELELNLDSGSEEVES